MLTFLGCALIGGVLALGIYATITGAIEDKKRRETPCTFSDGISKDQFIELVSKAAKPLKRLKTFYVEYTIVYGTVVSQSHQSEWKFNIDFNDYGHITGKYWINSENTDSNLPETFAKRISEEISAQKNGRL